MMCVTTRFRLRHFWMLLPMYLTYRRMRRDLKQAPGKWELAILGPDRAPRDISSLLAMLELLWQGQSDRHGGVAPTVPIPSDAADMAVHLAVSLVQWFQSGAVRKRK